LTLRGIVAYAVRAARRGTVQLGAIIGDETVEKPLRIAEELAYSSTPNRETAPLAAQAAAAVAGKMRFLRTRETRQAALCLTRTAMATIAALDAAVSVPTSARAKSQAALAAREAANCARESADALGGGAASEQAVAAACADYWRLLKRFGVQKSVTLGEPIPKSESI
jgi:hypothetical protein